MDMNYNEATNDRDAVKVDQEQSFRIEYDEAFLVNEFLTPQQQAKALEIMGSLDKSSGVERKGETEMHYREDSGASKYLFKGGKGHAEDDQTSEENGLLALQNELSGLLDQLEPRRSTPKEHTSQNDPVPSLPSHVADFLKYAKHKLAGMRDLAAVAKDKFRDPELGIRYQKDLLRCIDETLGLLDSYADYLSLTYPTRETNTMNSLLEGILTKHTEQLEKHQIKIIKKQFVDDLPETTVPEAQLEYIFDSLMQYITHSTPPNGNIALLTRLVDDPQRSKDDNNPLLKDRKCIEVLFAFSHYKKSEQPSPSHGGQGMKLILLLVKKITEKNKGYVVVKPSDKNAMTFISIKVPAEGCSVL
jgi:hypothetical protein